jgi:hypothetical protein
MDIRYHKIQVVIYEAPDDTAEPEFTYSINGETVFRGEIDYLGPKGGLTLFVHGGEPRDPRCWKVQYGPTEDGWTEYERGVMDALCALEGSNARIRGQIPFSWAPWSKGPQPTAGII